MKYLVNFLQKKSIQKLLDTSPSFFGASRRARTGTFGENIDYSKTYYIYVHKKDYDHATNLLRK